MKRSGTSARLLQWTALAALPFSAIAMAAPPAASPSATANPARWPTAKSPAALSDAKTERMIDALLSRMTLAQKVGQLVQADISEIKPEDLARYPLGSILAGGNSGPYGNERATAADWQRLVAEYRAASLKPRSDGVAIPILFGVDAVHGHSNLPGATIFPHNIGLGAAHDVDLIRRIGAATAAEVAGSGIEWTFAPTLAVPQDLRWGRGYEGYGSDPRLVAQYARAMTLGLQGSLVAGRPLAANRVAATAKHFLADGGTANGKDQGDAIIDETTLVAQHALGYPAAIDAGALTVMASFSSWNGIKHHGNRSLLTDVLKQRMGFDGLVVGDWNGHGQVAGCTVTDCAPALMAGIDLFMAPDSWKGLYASLLRRAEAGEIPMSRIDDAARRNLRVKAKLGLLGDAPTRRADSGQIGAPAHLALAREAVAKSLVLLKNNGGVLPIRPGARVLVAGPGADSIAMQSGGWTVSWQGTDVVNSDFPNGQTVYAGIAAAVGEAGGSATLAVDGNFSQKPDVAIVVFGEKPYAEFLGDIPTLDYQPGAASDLALLKRLKSAGIPVVSVFLSGRPMFVSPEINASDAFVAAFLPGTQGRGIADVIVARRGGKTARPFTGRLSFPWPRDARSPVRSALFPRGYGLSYLSPTRVPILSEDPGMDVSAALNVENFFAVGRAPSPWSATLSDSGGSRVVEAGAAQSPTGAISLRPVDFAAQEDARLLSWTGNGAFSVDGPIADLSRQLNNAFALRLDLKVQSLGAAPVAISVSNVGLDATALLRAQPLGQARVIKIPLRCFADAGAKLDAVGNALRIAGGAGLSLTLQSARVEAVGEPLTCPPKAR